MIEIIFWVSIWTVIGCIVLVGTGVAISESIESKPNRYVPDWMEYCGYAVVFLFWLSVATLSVYGVTWFVTSIVQWVLGQ